MADGRLSKNIKQLILKYLHIELVISNSFSQILFPQICYVGNRQIS